MEILGQIARAASPFEWLWKHRETISSWQISDARKGSTEPSSELTILPSEIWARLLDFLTPAELGALASTSSTHLRVVRANANALYMMEPQAAQFSTATRLYKNVGTLVIACPSYLGEQEIASISRLRYLHTLRIYDTFRLSAPSLMRTLHNLTSLKELYLDCEELSASCQNDKGAWEKAQLSLTAMTALTRMEKLTLLCAPPLWNEISLVVLDRMTSLRTLDITFQVPPVSLACLAPLKLLQSLALGVSEQAIGATSLALDLPELPSLERLEAIDFCFTPTSIASLQRLDILEFTPWGWRKDDLKAFQTLENIDHISLHVTWLPELRIVSSAFHRLTSLTLIEFDVRRCAVLCGLTNLCDLGLEYPTFPPDSEPLRPISLMLREMHWLIGFRLIHLAHITRELAIAFAYDCHSLEHLEISACPSCFSLLADPSQNTCIAGRLTTFIVHCNGETLPYPENLVFLPKETAGVKEVVEMDVDLNDPFQF